MHIRQVVNRVRAILELPELALLRVAQDRPPQIRVNVRRYSFKFGSRDGLA